MTHLMYSQEHDNLIPRNMLQFVPTPDPQGRFHQPYSFDGYVSDVHDVLDFNGIQVLDEEYAVTKNNQRLFGVMEVAPSMEGELITATEWKYLIGLRGSHDQSISRGLSLGTQILVCSNLCFSGNLATFHSKQTTHLATRIGGLLNQALRNLPEQIHRQDQRFDQFKTYRIPEQRGNMHLVNVYRQGGLSSAQLGRAVNEWYEPTFDEHTESGHTAWRLLNAVTQAIKPTGQTSNPNTIHDRSIIASTYLDKVVNSY